TAMSDMYDNLERQKIFDFVDYAYDGTGILVLKGNPKKIANLDSFAGQAVGVEKGATQAVMLEELNESFKTAGKPAMTIMQYPDQPSALLAVQSGNVVADLTDFSTAAYIALTTESGSVYEVVVDPAAPTGYEGQPVGAPFLKENTQLRDAFQKALQALIDDGTYQTIIGHWGLLPVDSAQINQGTASGV
ncbi:MAG: transporter substrate-binding domain-containing protein, partial [Thermoleophilia bacterium]|nr:transporter substrate-binding domain-containing protein [Thermoleophilia bacterium]